MITENDFDLLVITATWLFGDEKAKVSLITPNDYTTFSKSRGSRKGGGVAVICYDQFKCFIIENLNESQSFEYFQPAVLVKNKSFSLFPVNRPEPNTASMGTFFLEFSFLLEEISIIANEILMLSDFNIHIVAQNPTTRQVNDNIRAFNLVQHVSDSIHDGHSLDLQLTRPGDFITNVVVDQFFYDHKVIKFDVKACRKLRRKIVKSVIINQLILVATFTQDIATHLDIIAPISPPGMQKMVEEYDMILFKIIDKHAHFEERVVNARTRLPWMRTEIMAER